MKFLKVLAIFLAAVPALAQTPDLDEVLDRAADYVAMYERTFVGVVAEETYRQDVRGVAGIDQRGFALDARGQRRDLKSDMLLVRAPPAIAGCSFATCSKWTASRCATAPNGSRSSSSSRRRRCSAGG
jgi:hypothetical protein